MTVTKPGFKNKAFFEQDAIENGESLRHVATVAKFLDLNNLGPVNMTGKKTKKLSGMTFLCKIAHRNKTVAHSFFHRLTMQMAVSVKKDC